jgi:hypothetical protein
MPERPRIPLWLKSIYTAFVCVLVPVYWRDYGPTNFLYFCDMAVFFTLAAVWTENGLWASMPAVGILAPQSLWIADFIGQSVGLPVAGLTTYMFDEKIPLFTRGLSFFHFWLPILLVWLVWRLRYDRRAFAAWTGTAWVLMLVGFFLIPPPPAPPDNPNLPVNINYVYGLGSDKPQEWMPPLGYLGLMLVGLPVVIFLPTHLVLARLFRPSSPVAPRQDSRTSLGTRTF